MKLRTQLRRVQQARDLWPCQCRKFHRSERRTRGRSDSTERIHFPNAGKAGIVINATAIQDRSMTGAAQLEAVHGYVVVFRTVAGRRGLARRKKESEDQRENRISHS